MSKIDDGGPAFPSPYSATETMTMDGEVHQVAGQLGHPGMSLRDYFAGQNIQGALAGDPGFVSYKVVPAEGQNMERFVADMADGARRKRAIAAGWAYSMADAMIRASSAQSK